MRLLERHYDRLFGDRLPPEEFDQVAVCVDITAAATDFFLGNSQEYWDFREHFGSLAAPPLGWYEYAPPAQLRVPWGLQRLRPPELSGAEARIGYRVTRLPVEEHKRRSLLQDDPLPELIYTLCSGTPPAPGTLDRRTGVAVQTVMLCEVVAHNAQAGLLSQLFGLYLDEEDKPLPELLAVALPGPLSALGQHAAVQLCPLFYALSALNSGVAYLQPAASSPAGAGQAVALRFEEVVMRNPGVPVVSHN
jgi:hypothetical protein